jgi:tol-pal system protein YbgF
MASALRSWRYPVAVGRGLFMGALAACLVLGAPARAALFEDEDARKAILDLRARLAAEMEGVKTRLEAEKARIDSALAELKRAGQRANEEGLTGVRRQFLDLQAQIDELRQAISQVRGQQEQLARDVANLQRLQRDSIQSLDDRLIRLEPVPVTVEGVSFQALPAEKLAFEQSLAALRAGEFDKAIGAFQNFVLRFPSSGYLVMARFWSGQAYYARQDYKNALASWNDMLRLAPRHGRAPEAMLAIADTYAEMKDRDSTRKALEDLIKTFQGSPAAKTAEERLAALPPVPPPVVELVAPPAPAPQPAPPPAKAPAKKVVPKK